MSEKGNLPSPPALLARQVSRSARNLPSSTPSASTSTEESWLDLFKLRMNDIKFPEMNFNLQKKHIVIAVAVTSAFTMGGFLAWYIYRASRPSADDPESENKKLLGIDPIDSVTRLGRKKKMSATDSNKNFNEGVLILHQCPRGRRTPCIAPYPLKLETFLRIHGIKYEVDFNNMEPRTTDAPWITLDLEDICDSQNCMRFLVNRYSLELEKGFSEVDKANCRAYTHLLENHLYWGIALWRWVYDNARSLGEIQLLPAKTLQMIPQVCKTVEQAAWFHGIGKKSPRDVNEAIILDLKALSHLLGDKKYFIGEKACELDCTAFAMLAQMLWNMDGSPYEKAIKDNHQNLVEFCWRMRTIYWPDWESCLNNEGYDESKHQFKV